MEAATAEGARTGELQGISRPVGAQLEFIKCGALVKKFQAGQGGGKTVAGVFEVRRYVKRHPGAIVICTEPTYPMVRDILRPEFDRQFAAAGEEPLALYRQKDEKYVLWNGAEIWLRQCDQQDRLRGPSVAAGWMDEAGQSPYGAFQILSGRLRQQGYPHLLMLTGTPRGKNWFHWVFEKGERPQGAPPYIGDVLANATGEEPAVFSWGSLDNPYLDPVTKALLAACYTPGTLAYRQEVLGEVVAGEGLVYPQFDFDRHVRRAPRTERLVQVVVGVDWGWTNPGVMLAVGLDSSGRIWALEEVYATEQGMEWWAEAGKRLLARWQASGLYCDPAEPGNIAALREGGLPARKANNAVLPGIAAVASKLSADDLRICPGCRHTIQELGLYEWREQGGQLVADEPAKGNDHAMDALRYAVLGLLEPRRSGRIATGTAERGDG